METVFMVALLVLGVLAMPAVWVLSRELNREGIDTYGWKPMPWWKPLAIFAAMALGLSLGGYFLIWMGSVVGVVLFLMTLLASPFVMAGMVKAKTKSGAFALKYGITVALIYLAFPSWGFLGMACLGSVFHVDLTGLNQL